MSEIILVVIAIALSIASSYIKKRRREQAEIENETPDDPWRDIYPQYQEIEYPEMRPSQTLSVPVETQKQPEDPNRTIEVSAQNSISKPNVIAQQFPSEIEAEHEESTKVSKKSIHESSFNKEEKDFNLRDAVIYSEILKPKF